MKINVLIIINFILLLGLPEKSVADEFCETVNTVDGRSTERLFVLIDGSGGMVNAATSYGPYGDRGIKYWERVFTRDLPSWLRKQGHKDTDTTVFTFGLSPNEDWEKDFLKLRMNGSTNEATQELYQYGKDLIEKNKTSENKVWGIGPSSRAALLGLLEGCNKKQSIKGNIGNIENLSILYITDSGSNRSSDGELEINDAQAVKRTGRNRNVKHSDLTWLWEKIEEAKQHYNTKTEIKGVVFIPGEIETLPIVKTLADGRYNDYALSATLSKVTPSKSVDFSKHIQLADAIQFKLTRSGYTASVGVVVQSDVGSNYSPISMCGRVILNSEEVLEQCVELGSEEKSLNFTIDTQKYFDDEPQEFPTHLQLKAKFRYRPPQMDLGLVVAAEQVMPVFYQPLVYVRDTVAIDRNMLGRYPNKTFAEIRNFELALADQNTQANWQKILLATVGFLLLLAVIVVYLFRRAAISSTKANTRTICENEFATKHHFPDVQIVSQLVLPNQPWPEGQSSQLSCESLKINLEHYPSVNNAAIAIAKYRIANLAESNQFNEQPLITGKVELQAINISGANVKHSNNLLSLGGITSQGEVQFNREIEWVLLLNLNGLKNLHEVKDKQFTISGQIAFTYEEIECSCLFEVAVELKPAKYRFAASMELIS